nr:MAG TPA: hypothetical protein [Ackermannviridae sp.]
MFWVLPFELYPYSIVQVMELFKYFCATGRTLTICTKKAVLLCSILHF